MCIRRLNDRKDAIRYFPSATKTAVGYDTIALIWRIKESVFGLIKQKKKERKGLNITITGSQEFMRIKAHRIHIAYVYESYLPFTSLDWQSLLIERRKGMEVWAWGKKEIIDCSRCMYSSKIAAKPRTSFRRGEREFLCWRNKSNTHIFKHSENRERLFYTRDFTKMLEIVLRVLDGRSNVIIKLNHY